MVEKWPYLEKEPAADAPICDNMSGMYCPECRAVGYSHCADVEYCGGMRLMRPAPDQPADPAPKGGA